MSDATKGGGHGAVAKSSRSHRVHWLLERSPLLLAFAIVVIGFFPGYMNADSLIQIDQARGAGPLTDQYAPLIDWLWKLGWPLGLRPGAVLCLQVAAFLAGTYLVLRTVMRPLGASIATALIALFPPVLGQLGLLGRDTWFTALLVLGFGLIALAVRAGPRPAHWPLALAAVTLLLALAARQNAAPAVLCAAILGSVVVLGPRLASRRRLIAVGVPVLAGLALTLGGLALNSLAVRAIGPLRAHPDQYVYAYDLGHLSLDRDRILIPASVYPAQDLAAIETTLTYETMIPMISGPAAPLPMALPSDQVSRLRSAWWDEVRADPGAYLSHRLDAWAHQISLVGPPHIVNHPGIDASYLGYVIEFTRANDVLAGYLALFADDAFDGGLLQRPWLYLVLGALIVALLIGRRDPAARLAVALISAAWAYQVGLLFGASAVQYRYEFPAVTLVVIGAAVAAARAWPGWRSRYSEMVSMRRPRGVSGPGSR